MANRNRIDRMRAEIKEVYPGWGWRKRVDSMADNQVFAIFLKFKSEGRFDKPKKVNNKKEPIVDYHQVTLDEWLIAKGELV